MPSVKFNFKFWNVVKCIKHFPTHRPKYRDEKQDRLKFDSWQMETAYTSANWTFPVSTRSLASELIGIAYLTTGWRFKISDTWKGAIASRSYLRAAIVMPTCSDHLTLLVKMQSYSSKQSNRLNNISQIVKWKLKFDYKCSTRRDWKNQKPQNKVTRILHENLPKRMQKSLPEPKITYDLNHDCLWHLQS